MISVCAGHDLHALGVAFVSLAEGIDATTPAGKLQMDILGAIAEFERARAVSKTPQDVLTGSPVSCLLPDVCLVQATDRAVVESDPA